MTIPLIPHTKVQSPTIQQLVDEHKVILDVLLADLAKVCRHDVTHLVEEFEHHGGVDILLGDGRQPDVGALDMEKAGAGNVGHRGSNLLAGVNHVHTERVHRITPRMGGRMRKREGGCFRLLHNSETVNNTISPYHHIM